MTTVEGESEAQKHKRNWNCDWKLSNVTWNTVSLKDLVADGSTVYAIKSVSSGYYLDGRGVWPDEAPCLTNRYPLNVKCLNWTIVKTNNGVALKSVSSNQFLQSSDRSVSMNKTNPTNAKDLQWKFIDCDKHTIAIRSVENNRFLEVWQGKIQHSLSERDPTDNKYLPSLSERDPTYDKYLQWRFIKM